MKKLLPMLLFFLVPAVSFGQGSIVNDIALKNLVTGIAPAAGATVTVCTSAGTGIPCTPLATVYSDIALTVPKTNPITADSNGYYSFYAAPGRYVVTVTGAGVSGRSITYILPSDTSGNNNWTGTNIFINLNGCAQVNALQSFAAALAAASTSGCIIVNPGTYTVSANSTIPAGVTLGFSQGAMLSIANTFLLTINGQIIAPATQIFAYVGSGTVSLATITSPIYANWFPGADLGVQLNNAYAAAPSGAFLTAASQTACYQISNTINFNTIGKRVTLAGTGPSGANLTLNQGGLCIQDTRTGGASFTIANSPTGATQSGNTVTITCTTTCTGAGALVVGSYVNLSGVGVAGYNIPSVVLSTPGAPGTTFTTTNPWFTSLAASGSGTAQIMPVTINLDWEGLSGNGTFGPGEGLRELTFLSGSTNCQTAGGCGNNTVGISIGPINGGAQQALLANVKTTGYGVARMISGTPNTFGWQQYFFNNSSAQDTYGFMNTTAVEGVTFTEGTCVNDKNCFYSNTADLHLTNFHMDSPTNMGVQCVGGTVEILQGHLEFGLGTTTNSHMVNGGCNLIVDDSTASDDQATSSTDYWFSTLANTTLHALAIGSAGRTVTTLALCSGACDYEFLNSSPATLTEASLCPSSTAIQCKNIVNSTNTIHNFLPSLYVGGSDTSINARVQINYNSGSTQALGFNNTAASGRKWSIGDGIGVGAGTFAFYDATASALRASLDSTGFWNLPTAGSKINVNSSINTALIAPTTAGTGDLCSTLLPCGNLFLGTAATNAFKFQPAATAAARVISMPDPLAATNMAFLATVAVNIIPKASSASNSQMVASSMTDNGTTVAVTGESFTPAQTNGIVGTTTNNNANAGSVGEYVASTIVTGSSVALTTNVTANVTSISLTAGDWDVTGAVDFTFGATTSYTNLIGSVSSTSATIGAQDSKFDFETPAAVPTAGADATFPLPVVRFSLSGTTTVFLVAQGTFTVSTLKAYGTISARRVR